MTPAEPTAGIRCPRRPRPASASGVVALAMINVAAIVSGPESAGDGRERLVDAGPVRDLDPAVARQGLAPDRPGREPVDLSPGDASHAEPV